MQATIEISARRHDYHGSNPSGDGEGWGSDEIEGAITGIESAKKWLAETIATDTEGTMYSESPLADRTSHYHIWCGDEENPDWEVEEKVDWEQVGLEYRATQEYSHKLTLIGRTPGDLRDVDCDDAIQQVCDSVDLDSDLPDDVEVSHAFDCPPCGSGREVELNSTDEITGRLAERGMYCNATYSIEAGNFLPDFWDRVRDLMKGNAG